MQLDSVWLSSQPCVVVVVYIMYFGPVDWTKQEELEEKRQLGDTRSQSPQSVTDC